MYLSTLGRLKLKSNKGCLRCSVKRVAKVGEVVNGFEIVSFLDTPSKNRTYYAKCPLCGDDFSTTLQALKKENQLIVGAE